MAAYYDSVRANVVVIVSVKQIFYDITAEASLGLTSHPELVPELVSIFARGGNAAIRPGMAQNFILLLLR
jgi:hypothetical protein